MITTTEAAAIAHVKRVTILKWIERGHLKATEFGNVWMIDPKDLENMKERKNGRPKKIKESK